MKKRLLTAIAVSFCIGSYAQTEKGKIILGGSIGFNSNKVNSQATQKATSFNLGPSIGLFVGENAVIGLGLEYATNKTDPYSYTVDYQGVPYTSSTHGSKSESIGFTPFFRYYWNLHERVKLFGQVNTGISWGTSFTLNLDGTEVKNTEDTSLMGSIQPGIAIFPYKKIAIELKVPLASYFYQKNNYKDPSMASAKFNSFSLGSDLAKPVLGINFHF